MSVLYIILQFPGEDNAIDQYMDLHEGIIDLAGGVTSGRMRVIFKVLPSWVTQILLKFDLITMISRMFSGDYMKSLQGWAKPW